MDKGLDQSEEMASQLQVNEMPVDSATEEEVERLDLLEKQKRRAEFYRQNPQLIGDDSRLSDSDR